MEVLGLVCCSVCEKRYEEEPLKLQCGHVFCRNCLWKTFAAAKDSPTSSAGGGSDAEFSLGAGGRCGVELARHGDLELVKRIGEGRRAEVEIWAATLSGACGWRGKLLCRHKVAVRKVAIGDEIDVVWVQKQLEELRQSSMSCRYVCRLHGVTRMDNSLCIVTERCYGSVQSEMLLNGRLPPEKILRYGADIAKGVAELHAAGVVCMNLKPSNLLVDASGHAVVSDYGLPAILKNSCCTKAQSDSDTSTIHSCMDCTMLSPHYTAPEAYNEEALGISAESDAWSFGCTLVEMCTGSAPWAGLSAEEIYEQVVKGPILPPQYATVVDVGIPRELLKMIEDCLQFEASKRPTFSTMLGIFLNHLQDLALTLPDTDLMEFSPANVIEPSPTSVLKAFQCNASHFHRLVSEGDVTGVRIFLANAASANGGSAMSSLLEAQNCDGQTALHLACRRGSEELVEALLAYKEAKVDIRDKDGDPPLAVALAAGSPGCVPCALLILENGGCTSMGFMNSKNITPLHICVTTYNVAVLKRWVEVALTEEIKSAIDIPSLFGTALCMAAALEKDHEKERREMVRILLAAGANPITQDAQGHTPLHTAAMANDEELVKIILAAGVDVNIRNAHNKIPLHVALARGAKSCIAPLLSAGADCNFQADEGNNAFHIAAKIIRENLEWVVLMLRCPDADVGLKNHSGETVCDILETLPEEWILEVMEALGIDRELSPTTYEVSDRVEFRRSISNPTYEWQDAKHKSAGFEQSIPDDKLLTTPVMEVFRFAEGTAALTESWDRISLSSDDTVSQSTLVAEAFNLAYDKFMQEGREMVRILLAAGANPIAQDAQGHTPLHTAAMANDEEISEEVLEALGNSGETVLDSGETVFLSPTTNEVSDRVEFSRCISNPTYGWQDAKHKSVSFERSISDKEHLVESSCTGEHRRRAEGTAALSESLDRISISSDDTVSQSTPVAETFNFADDIFKQAQEGISALKENVDITVISSGQSTPVTEAISLSDDILTQGVQGIPDIITTPGLVNVDAVDPRADVAEATTGSTLPGASSTPNSSRRRSQTRIPATGRRFVKRRRRRVRFWTDNEVFLLKKGVERYGLGNWKNIKALYADTFQERTGMDLKDKWRNLTKESKKKENAE